MLPSQASPAQLLLFHPSQQLFVLQGIHESSTDITQKYNEKQGIILQGNGRDPCMHNQKHEIIDEEQELRSKTL